MRLGRVDANDGEDAVMNEVQQVDVEQIMERIRENIRRRRSAGDIPTPEPDTSPFLHGEVSADLDYLHSMATLLRAKGHEVGLAVNATVALSVARVFRPDTVMLDVKLPNGDGRMLAAQLRREVGLQDMRIVCVTGYAEEDPRKSLESGCDAHYIKPLAPAVIDRLLADSR